MDPCSTQDYDAFYAPRIDLEAQMSYIKQYKPMQCLNENAYLTLTPNRQSSSQAIGGVAHNEGSSAVWTGEDV